MYFGNSISLVLFCALTFISTSAKILIIPNVVIDPCTDILQGKEAGVIDSSNLQLYAENNTNVFLNGSIIFTEQFDTFPFRIYIEKYVLNKWVKVGIDRAYDDICMASIDFTLPFHQLFRDFPECPITDETVWLFDMVPIKFPIHLLLNTAMSLVGHWRTTIIFDFNINGEQLMDCRHLYAEIYDEASLRALEYLLQLNLLRKS